MDGRISITDCAEVALEMTDVDRIEPNLDKPTPSQNDCPNVIANSNTQSSPRVSRQLL
jgi:hypothetical protein